MKLKSYFASTVEAAMNMARMELGSDAMLVSSRRTDAHSRHLGEYEVVFAATAYQNSSAMNFLDAPPVAAVSKAPPIEKLSGEVAGLKHELERLASALARSTTGMARIASNPGLADAFSNLIAAELDADLAQDVAGRIAAQFGSNSTPSLAACNRMIAGELGRLFSVDSRLGRERGRNVIAFVGPPGAGKTTTLIKLAVRYGLATRRPSHILTLDTQRVGSAELLRSYATITGIGFQAVGTPRALLQAIEEHPNKEFLFIDTPALSCNALEEAVEISKAFMRHPDIDSDNWPSFIVERLELQNLLAEAIEKMPPNERIVLSLYYHEELTLREIAKVVKLHESRISQLKSQAILRLRTYMQKRWPMQKGA